MQSAKIKKIKSALSLVAFVVIVGSAFGVSAILSQNKYKTVEVAGHTLKVEVADEDEERRRGLCCRDSLNSDSGMLFVYDEPGFYPFWMKDTRIPLDIIWVSSSKKIVHIEESVLPSSYPSQSFVSPKPAQYILETNASWAEVNDITIGDTVQFN